MGFQFLGIKEFARKNGLLLILVRIKRRNALFGGTILFLGKTHLFQLIQIAMPGKQQGGTIADFEVVWRNFNPFCHYILHFRPEIFRIESNTVAKNVDDAVSENARGQ